MSLSWNQRKQRLATLLKSNGDEDSDGTALDRILHGQSVIGKTSKTSEIDALRFQDKDLNVVGTLAYGQFGVIDVVTCRLNGRVYVRKSIEKRFALRTRDQCFPQFERDILLQALKMESAWAPHLLCAFQTPTHLNLVMDYAEGGTLWDVLESSPHNGRVLEADLRWWTPQIIMAIHWCHSQGFAHRDVKPHNFVLTPDAHVLLIDFGSAAPLLPPDERGVQLLPKRYCLVPCGTCDYISPEILRAHEEALVALEMDEDDECRSYSSRSSQIGGSEGYGVETDWWSLGAMLFEMAYGVAPFFASDIRQTYTRIMNHSRSLRFKQNVGISAEYQHFLHRLLTDAEHRLGRHNVMEITDHPVFFDVDWTTLPNQIAPLDLHLPQFTYTEPQEYNAAAAIDDQHQYDESLSQGFAFSALFQSSKATSPGLSILRPSPAVNTKSSMREDPGASSFIGFSWGPTIDAFPSNLSSTALLPEFTLNSPHSLRVPSTHLTPSPLSPLPGHGHTHAASLPTPAHLHLFSTPTRPYSTAFTPLQTSTNTHGTIRRASTIRRTGPRRTVSDREAMKQLVDCVGMSARKKVLESGRKPRILTSSFSGGTLRRKSKELRFDPSATPIPVTDHSSSRQPLRPAPLVLDMPDDGGVYSGSEAEMTESEGPPSPSPSPRPGSAMSIMSSRRSGTPTITGTFSQRNSSSGTGTGLLSLPSARRTSFASSHSVLGAGGGEDDIDDSRSRSALRRILSFEDMEKRYGKMMDEIEDIEDRLEEISQFVH